MLYSPFKTRQTLVPAEQYPWSPVSDAEQWSLFENQPASPEVEVCRFLEALVVLLKPNIIVETGTGSASSTASMARGIRTNRRGLLFTYELDVRKVEAAQLFLINERLYEYVTCYSHDTLSTSWPHDKPIDLFFCDGADNRFAELKNFESHFHKDTIIVAHDAANPAHNWDLFPGYAKILFSTPVGLLLMQKI